MEGQGKKKSFWTSLPGILTGLAAVLAAAGTLYTALRDRKGPEPSSPPRISIIMVISGDVAGKDADVYLDGEYRGRLQASGSRAQLRISNTPPGVHQLKVTKPGHEDFSTSVTVTPQQTTEVNFELVPAQPPPIKSQDRKQPEDSASARPPKRASPVARELMSPVPDSIITDKRTGLMWTRKDNGYDINWDDADRYCEGLKLGGYTDWRLPTMVELLDLYDPNAEGERKIRAPFELTGWEVWTHFKGVFLRYGLLLHDPLLVDSSVFRALCMRPSGE